MFTLSQRVYFLTVLMMQMSCTKPLSSALKGSFKPSGSPELGRSLTLGETVTLQSPLTPLAHAIRRQALADVRNRREGAPTSLESDGQSLSASVKKAILDTLATQPNPTSSFAPTSNRACRIASNLLTPADIVYALQRAVLGRVEDDHPMIDGGIRQSWRALLGYNPDTMNLIVEMEAWLQHLEKNGLEQLPQKVRDSLGVKKIGRNTDPILDKMIMLNLGPDRTDLEKFEASISSHGQVRCFVTGQMHWMPLAHMQFAFDTGTSGENIVNTLLRNDVFEAITRASLWFKQEKFAEGIRYVNSKDSIVSLDLGAHGIIASLRIFNSGDLRDICEFKIPDMDKMSDAARQRIKRVRLARDTVRSSQGAVVNVIKKMNPQFTAERYEKMLKRYFPNATEFMITSGFNTYEDSFSEPFIARLLTLLAKSGAKKINLLYEIGTTIPIHEHIPDATTLEGIEQLVVQTDGRTESKFKVPLSLTRLLSKIPTIRTLRISRMENLEGSSTDFANIKTPMALEHLYISDCGSLRAPLRISLDSQKFPYLKSVTLSNCKNLSIENLPAKVALLKNLEINDLLEIVQKVASENMDTKTE